MRQRILLRRIHRQVIFARSCRIDELHDYVLAHALDIAPTPRLPRIRGCGTPALFLGSVICTTRWMAVNLVWRAPHDIHVTAISLPSWNTRGVMFIRVSDPPVMLFFEFVIRQIWISAAAQPELLDELFTFFVSGQLSERVALFRRNNVDHVLVEPLLVRGVQFLERLANFLLLGLIETLMCGGILLLRCRLLLLRPDDRHRKRE